MGDVGVSGVPDELGKDGARRRSRSATRRTLSAGGRRRERRSARGAPCGARAYREAECRDRRRASMPNAPRASTSTVRWRRSGSRSILREVVVEGGDASKPWWRGAIVLTPDAPLDPDGHPARRGGGSTTSTSTGASTSMSSRLASAAPPPSPAAAPVEQPVVSRRLCSVERPRYRVRYGLAVSDEEIGPDERDRRLGVAADLENRNVFGRNMTRGALAAAAARSASGPRHAGSQPAVRARRFARRVFVEREREQLNPEGAFPITSDVTALSAEQAYPVRRATEFRYGYGIERNHTFIRN